MRCCSSHRLLRSHLAVASRYVRRFGKISNVEIRSQQSAVRPPAEFDWLSAPRRSPLTAIAWKQSRESGPLVVAGLVGIVGLTLVIAISNLKTIDPHRFSQMLSAVSFTLGSAITLITGIGVCFYDVVPQVNTFWRSRPIDPDTWFWSKFVTGLAVLLLVLDLPILVVLTAIEYGSARFTFSAPVYIAAQLALFSAAVVTTCLTRHAVYSAILSIPLTFSGMVLVWIATKTAGAIGWITRVPETLGDLSPLQCFTGFVITFIACTVLGWLAVRCDWGRKSRY